MRHRAESAQKIEISDHQLGVWGWPIEEAGTTLCWWSLICDKEKDSRRLTYQFT